MMNLNPLKNDADYEPALAEIERLFDAAPGTPECDRLEVLATLVEAYEDQKYDLPMPDPVEAIKYYVESRGLSLSDWEQHLGNGTAVTDVLNRKQPLTIDMIRRLHAGLGIPADILIQPYAIAA